MTSTSGSQDAKTLELLVVACDMAADIVSRGREQFEADQVLSLASEAVLNRLGEGLGRLSETTLESAPPGLPTMLVRGMRNRVVHRYQLIDYDVVWTTLERDVPRLQPVFRAMQSEHS